jgi:DNA ligase (NAD+)
MDIQQLESQILAYRKSYYEGNPQVSDAEYDALEDLLRDLCPHSHVLSKVGSDSGRVTHIKPMLSLRKTYDIKEFVDFVSTNKCIVTSKLDGVSLSVRYSGCGELISAQTRGDGTAGHDVTAFVKFAYKVFPQLPTLTNGVTVFGELAEYIDFIGELVFPLDRFHAYSHQFENPRNAVAGLLGRKDLKDSTHLCNSLLFVPYDCLVIRNNQIITVHDTYSKKIQALNSCFSHTIAALEPFKCSELDTCDLLEMQSQDMLRRDKGYLCDGIVARIDSCDAWDSAGVTSHHPRGSLALKERGACAVTQILDVEVAIGRTGRLTFTGIIQPISLSGATLSRVSMHNHAYMIERGYIPGAYVQVTRSGEVIPYITGLVSQSNQPWCPPTRCPYCDSVLIEQGVNLVCSGPLCDARVIEQLAFFTSAMRILGLARETIRILHFNGLLNKPVDIYKLPGDERAIKVLGTEKHRSISNQIEQSKTQSLATLLTALGIPDMGSTKCAALSTYALGLPGGIVSLLDNLEDHAIQGITPRVMTSLATWLSENKAMLLELLSFVRVQGSVPSKGSICITGTLSVPRKQIEELLTSKGWEVTSSVGLATNYLLCNKVCNSSKYTKALKLGTKIITEQELEILM